MTDRDESDLRPDGRSKDHSIERTEVVSPECGLSTRDSLIAALLVQNRLVEAREIEQAQSEMVNESDGRLLELLVDRGLISNRLKSSIEAIADELSERGTADIESTGVIDDTLSSPTARLTAQPADGKFGDYEILEEIAKGGMGVVYKARQTNLDRIVALKMIRSAEFADDEQVSRLYTEARAAAKLDHPGIVPVFEVGEINDQHFYSMGFIEGESLNNRVKRDGPLEPRSAAEIIRGAAEAVQHAHDADVVHRDIKPANILMDRSGQPRVADFGLAKLRQADTEMTATGQVLGTPAYMPPEQATGKIDQIGVAADVYSLGATFYFLLVGRAPFETASIADTLRQVIETDPVALRKLNPAIPRDLETICLKCLRKEVASRYAKAQDLAADLRRWIDGEPIVARRVGRVERAWKWCKRKPVVAALAAVILFVLIVGGTLFWERQNASYVDGLVNSLVNANAPQVPPLLEELAEYHWWSEPRLRQRLDTAREGSIEELHLALALLADDHGQTDILMRQLLAATPDHVELIRSGLSDQSSPQDVTRLWQLAMDSSARDSSRLNAVCVLSALDPHGSRWVNVGDDVARQLVEALASNPRDYETLVSMLNPVSIKLAEPLGRVYREPSLTALQQETAMNVLVEYAVGQPSVLCDVAMDADATTFQRLFPLIEPLSEEATALFAAEIARSRDETVEQLEKERIGQRQANAAIALMRLSQTENALPVLSRRRDPRAGSWFVHRVDEFAVSPERLLDRLDLQATGDEPLMIQMSLLQALGQFGEEQLPRDTRDKLIPDLLGAYRDHPDPGLHGSIAWLLRQWDETEELLAADVEMQLSVTSEDGGSEESNSGGASKAADPRRWYVNSQGQTMVILNAGEFMMGTEPDSDPDIFPDEIYHLRRIKRSFAIAATEVTKAQFREFEQGQSNVRVADNPHLAEFVRTEDSPMTAVTWYDAAGYCNWLSEQEGIPKDQWCYAPNDAGEYGEGMRIKENFWDLSGYRLPTEAEWEYASRAGSVARRYYGYTEGSLGRYARYEVNGEGHLWPVGFTPPNPFGLFDTLGNAFEWCQDEFDGDYSEAVRIEKDDELVAIVDEQNWDAVSDSTDRVLRGGSFGSIARLVRSAVRYSAQPSNRNTSYAFRIARTYHSSP